MDNNSLNNQHDDLIDNTLIISTSEDNINNIDNRKVGDSNFSESNNSFDEQDRDENESTLYNNNNINQSNNNPIDNHNISYQNNNSNNNKISPTNISNKPKRAELCPGDFYFGSTLGEGAYARVVHARMKKYNSPDFAVKIMDKNHIKKENKVKYVMMEKNILSKVSHPFIIKFYFSFQDANYLYMCMDLAPGGELLSVILLYRNMNEEKGITNIACDETISRFYIAEVIEALDYLHNNGIIHRDLKPENVLITATGHIKITDFGTSLIGDDEDVSRNSFVGTAEYVSPEVLHNEPVTRSCDLWAVGCMLYQMLIGSTPFHSPSEYLTFQNILDHSSGSIPLQYPSTISSDAKDVISRLLLPASNERIGATNIQDLKNHNFFHNIKFGDELVNMSSPYIPSLKKLPSNDEMRNGADDEWMLEGEANPIIKTLSNESMTASISESNQSIERSNSNRLLSNFFRSYNGSPHRSISRTNCNCLDVQTFLGKNENLLFTSIIYKRVGLFSKKRQLILTDLPRLFYIDPETSELKGKIPWTLDCPVRCEIINDISFDVLSKSSGRKYHLTANDCGSKMWVDLINAMLEKQREMHGLQIENV